MLSYIHELSLPLQTVLVSILCLVAIKIFIFTTSGMCRSKAKLEGKTVIITGANTGLGKETAIDLAQRGARVILACRNVEKAELAKDEIIKASRNHNVVVRELDLASLSSVRRFATSILESESRLDILINNAGVAGQAEKQLTEDGLEYRMQSNYFGHFLLTNLLLGLLKKTAPSRVINVSSLLHKLVKDLDFSNLNSETSYSPGNTYQTSKLCQILFSRHLAKLTAGSGVTVNSLHPGLVKTDVFRYPSFRNFMIRNFILPFSKNAKEGAQTTIYLAVDDEVEHVTGKYFSDCKVCEPSKSAKDDGVAKKLWEVSEVLVNLKPEERQF